MELKFCPYCGRPMTGRKYVTLDPQTNNYQDTGKFSYRCDPCDKAWDSEEPAIKYNSADRLADQPVVVEGTS